tara:strand:- start:13143 stop:14087 length:945 start_codon:yes stop_codon:yes gene_type:complete
MNTIKQKLRVAVVGLGSWGQKIVKTIQQELPDATLTHIVTSNKTMQKQYMQQCEVLSNWLEVIPKKNEFDCLVAALPPNLNLKLAEDLLPHGIPIFFEKPLEINYANASKILSLAEQFESIVQVNHIDLYNPAIQEIRSRLKGKKIEVDATIGAAYPTRDVIRPLWEYSPHFIAASMELADSAPVKLEARQLPIPKELQDNEEREVVELSILFENGSLARIIAGNGILKKSRKMTVKSNKDSYVFEDRATIALSKNGNEIVVDSQLPLALSLKHFIDKVRNNDTSLTEFKSGVKVIKLLEIADQSLANNRKIAL